MLSQKVVRLFTQSLFSSSLFHVKNALCEQFKTGTILMEVKEYHHVSFPSTPTHLSLLSLSLFSLLFSFFIFSCLCSSHSLLSKRLLSTSSIKPFQFFSSIPQLLINFFSRKKNTQQNDFVFFYVFFQELVVSSDS